MSKKGEKQPKWLIEKRMNAGIRGRKIGKYVLCFSCKKKIYKYPSRIKRAKERGDKHFFCSISCKGKNSKGFSFSPKTQFKRGRKSPKWKGGLCKIPGYLTWLKHRRRYVNVVGNHTHKQWQKLKKQFNFTCLCCHKSEPEIRLTEDHIVPVIIGGNNWIDNIQPLCGSCNSKKGTKIIDFRTH
jgi:5-methylcytosine-specific restriction endonuclease McrA